MPLEGGSADDAMLALLEGVLSPWRVAPLMTLCLHCWRVYCALGGWLR